MVAYLSKSDASAGFDQIVDFLNAQVIQYALMVKPTIYVSCNKQFWATTSIKKVNDVVKLQALIDKKKVENLTSLSISLTSCLGTWISLASFSSKKEEEEKDDIPTAHTPLSPTTAPLPPLQDPIPTPLQAQPATPSSPTQEQPARTSKSSMTLLNTLLETCATLLQKVVALEQDKHS
nr:hypothetical protein [Tanacetum cinerariifolium]